jgi:cation:H+ antiporter
MRGAGSLLRISFRLVAPPRPSLMRPTFLMALLGPVPGIALRMELVHVPLVWETTLFGVAVLGAAFLLAWAAEVAQMDISQTLAIAVLALIAVLPEYAVDLFLAYRAGQGDEEKRHLAIANMTGANRLLIGIGWAVVVLIFVWKAKGKGGERELRLRPEQRTDVGFLLVATLWAFSIPIRGEIGLLDLVLLGGLFIAYIFRAAREEVEEPELIGAAAALGALPTTARRTVTVLLFFYAAAAILYVAEHFANGLIEIGKSFGISTFLLIQWVAPLASEAPEMIIAILFTVRMKAQAGMGTLISSKVNQWTLLVGTLGLVFSLGAGEIAALHLDFAQKEEVFLTAAQSLFAVAIIANLTISRNEALMMLALFFGQFLLPYSPVRIGFGIAYIVFAVGIFAFSQEARGGLLSALKHVFEPISRPRRARR